MRPINERDFLIIFIDFYHSHLFQIISTETLRETLENNSFTKKFIVIQVVRIVPYQYLT